MPTEQSTIVRRESGVRKYQNRSLLHRFYQWNLVRKLGSCGQGVYLEPNVEFQRHPEGVFLGDNVIVKEGARICPTNPNARISIGDWTTVGHNTFMFATVKISIGSNCLIAPFCYFVDANHGIKREQLIRDQKMSAAKITVGDDVWIGTNAIILKGVTIGNGAVIGAGSIVSQDVSEYQIVSGSPATSKGMRR